MNKKIQNQNTEIKYKKFICFFSSAIDLLSDI